MAESLPKPLFHGPIRRRIGEEDFAKFPNLLKNATRTKICLKVPDLLKKSTLELFGYAYLSTGLNFSRVLGEEFTHKPVIHCLERIQP